MSKAAVSVRNVTHSQHAEWAGCTHTTMTTMECLDALDQLVDESDPDVDFPNSFHAYQTAEAIRKEHPDKGQVTPTPAQQTVRCDQVT